MKWKKKRWLFWKQPSLCHSAAIFPEAGSALRAEWERLVLSANRDLISRTFFSAAEQKMIWLIYVCQKCTLFSEQWQRDTLYRTHWPEIPSRRSTSWGRKSTLPGRKRSPYTISFGETEKPSNTFSGFFLQLSVISDVFWIYLSGNIWQVATL